MPINDIHRALSDYPQTVQQQFTEFAPILELAKIFVLQELRNEKSFKDVIEQLSKVYPFSQYHQRLIEALEMEGILHNV